MPDTNDPFQVEEKTQPAEKQVDPRVTLSLLDLFVAVTVAVVVSALGLQIGGMSSVAGEDLFVVIVRLIYITICGTALFLFGRRWLGGVPTDFQPGHWLLCLCGIDLISQFLGYCGFYLAGPDGLSNQQDSAFPYFLILVSSTFPSVVQIGAGFLLPVRLAWRLLLIPSLVGIVLLWEAVAEAQQWLPEWFSHLYWFGMVVNTFSPILLLIVLVIWDRLTTSDRRDFIHWGGVVIYGLALGASILMNLPFIL
ncbi:hypothetical protein GC197_13075 [bacterium]|nr:hypothetical protein [bacterium]